MFPPGLKLRTLIVLVALATLPVGTVEYRRRAARYRALADREAGAEIEARYFMIIDANRHPPGGTRGQRFFRQLANEARPIGDYRSAFVDEVEKEARAETIVRDLQRAKSPGDSNPAFDESRQFAEYHARRRAAYLRCARYPWLSPPADEPEAK